MVRVRGPELSKQLHQEIWNLWVYKGMNARMIAQHINSTSELMSKFGKVTPDGIHYHIKQIREELDNTVNEDALDIYVAEFIRKREQMEGEYEDVQKLIDEETVKDDKDKDLILRLFRFRHEVSVDQLKMLQDVELPLAVKKMKIERNKNLPQRGVLELEEDEDERSSEQGDSSDNSISD